MREAIPQFLLEDRKVLPTHLKPQHYHLTIIPNFIHAKEFEGHVVIVLDVVEGTKEIVLNCSNEMTILGTEVQAEGKDVVVERTSYLAARDQLTIELGRKLEVGEEVRCVIKYLASHVKNGTGFFRSPYVGRDGVDKWAFSTQFEPTAAREALPCFDEPALKATFTLSMIVPRNITAFGNMDIFSEERLGGERLNQKIVTFNKTPLMSTYLLAFAAGDYKFIETNNFRIPIRVIATPDKNLAHGVKALELAARTLAAFEKIFDVAYPLPKLDLISVSNQQGAMENWGLICFVESALLIDDKDSSAIMWRRGAKTIVHEIAHQWFGNIVTMDFWDGLWLNEGFANWATYHAFGTLEPSWEIWTEVTSGDYQDALRLDSNKASHPIEIPVSNPNEINQIFDDISYKKGCAVLNMISCYLGTEVFVKGVSNYLGKHSYGNTVTTDLWDSLSDVSGIDVGKLMQTWTRQVGFPVIDVEENEGLGMIQVTQHRFFQDGTIPNAKEDEIVYPVFLKLGGKDGNGDEFVNDLKLYSRTNQFDAPLDFYKLNSGQTGFYRVAYPLKRLQILGQNAKDGLLSSEDKIGIIADALAMASSGHKTPDGSTKTSTVLDLLGVFEDESSYFVWLEVLAAFRAIDIAWAFEEESSLLKTIQTRLVKKILLKKGWDFNQNNEEGVDQVFKAVLFDAGSGLLEVQRAAKEMFDKYMAGDETAISVNILQTVFGIVLKNGGTREYNAVLAAASKSTSVDKRSICLYSLGYAEDPKLIARTLALSITPDAIIRDDTTRYIRYLTTHAQGTQALWNWLKTEYVTLRQVFGNGLGKFARLIEVIGSGLATEDHVNDIQAFFAGKETSGFDVYLAQTLNIVQTRANWVKRDRSDVKQWLEAQCSK